MSPYMDWYKKKFAFKQQMIIVRIYHYSKKVIKSANVKGKI